VSRVKESLGEWRFPLHASQLARFQMDGKTKHCPTLLLGRNHAVDGLSLLQLLLHLNHELDTINHHLHL